MMPRIVTAALLAATAALIVFDVALLLGVRP